MYPACDRLLEILSPQPSHSGSPVTATPAEPKRAIAPSISSNDPSHHARNRSHHICHTVVRHNLPVGLLAVGWILLSSMVFISPITNFNTFISRWFSSDTVAFLTIFMIAGMAAVVLFWLHVFLQILTILAVDALARIDIQAAGLSGLQAFWLLALVSLVGLAGGWLANGVL